MATLNCQCCNLRERLEAEKDLINHLFPRSEILEEHFRKAAKLHPQRVLSHEDIVRLERDFKQSYPAKFKILPFECKAMVVKDPKAPKTLAQSIREVLGLPALARIK